MSKMSFNRVYLQSSGRTKFSMPGLYVLKSCHLNSFQPSEIINHPSLHQTLFFYGSKSIAKIWTRPPSKVKMAGSNAKYRPSKITHVFLLQPCSYQGFC
jgi:hypothetical protein